MNRKTVFIVSALVLVAVFGAGVLLFKSDKLSRWSAVVGQNQAALARDHAPLLGNPGARVHIVEFMDPACETCAEFYPHVKRILAANPDRVKVSIRHVHLHPGSEDVVRMLEASRRQDRYWQTLEALFANQSAWVANHTASPDRAWGVLGSAGVDLVRLRADMNDPEIARRMAQDMSDAAALNVKATPEYFVNGKPMPSFGLPQLQGLVRDALQASY